jgi:hypothetical protein
MLLYQENSMNLTRVALVALAVANMAGIVRADERKPAAGDKNIFGVLQAPGVDDARAQALAWLKSAGNHTPASQEAFDAIWNGDRQLLDRVAATLELGSADARRLLAEARDPNAPAPQVVPAAIRDAEQPAFYRANLALAYAKELSNRRVYEEGLAALKTVKVESAVDPSSYLFYKAVAEHALGLKKEADDTILRLLDDVVDAPERHKTVAALMHFDMRQWRDKDLGWIARKMNNIERRLDLSRGGPQTQKMQKEVVMRLDELIKQLEQQGNQDNSGNCPDGGDGKRPGNTNRPNRPMPDSQIANQPGPGKVDPKQFKETAQKWGNLPERERAKAMVELTKDLPARQREWIEAYFKKLAGSD